LDISEAVPDHSTFRQTLEKRNLMEGLLSEINHQLSNQGLYIKSGKVSIHLVKRAYRNKPLNKEAKQLNWIHSGVRCTVERVFGVLKQHYGMAKGRYLGLNKNRTRFELNVCDS